MVLALSSNVLMVTAQVLPNKHEDIEGIRVVRDPETLVGKGIGYLLLRDRDAVMKALSLHQELFKKRWALRVTTCGKRTKRTEQRAKPHVSAASNSTGGGLGDAEAPLRSKLVSALPAAPSGDRSDKKRK